MFQKMTLLHENCPSISFSVTIFHFQCFLWTRFGKEDMPPHFSFLFLSFRYILLLSSFLTHVVEKQHAETLLSSQTCFAWRKGQAFYDGFHVIVQKSLEVTAFKVCAVQALAYQILSKFKTAAGKRKTVLPLIQSS